MKTVCNCELWIRVPTILSSTDIPLWISLLSLKSFKCIPLWLFLFSTRYFKDIYLWTRLPCLWSLKNVPCTGVPSILSLFYLCTCFRYMFNRCIVHAVIKRQLQFYCLTSLFQAENYTEEQIAGKYPIYNATNWWNRLH